MVEVTSGTASQFFLVSRSGSYLSSSDGRILAGLGATPRRRSRSPGLPAEGSAPQVKADEYLRVAEPPN